MIPANSPFGLLGSTQLVNAAKLIAMMDHGHGFVDRFLIATPHTQRTTLTEIDQAKANLNTEVIDDYDEIFERIHRCGVREFHFDAAGNAYLCDLVDQFVAEFNEAIREGRVPHKSKTPEFTPRVATALHVFNHVMHELLSSDVGTTPPVIISKETLQNAASYVHHLESQKDIFCQVSVYHFRYIFEHFNNNSRDCALQSIRLFPGSHFIPVECQFSFVNAQVIFQACGLSVSTLLHYLCTNCTM